MSDELRHAQQQVLMRRPWDVAEPQSFWSITGGYPGKNHTFTDCLAMALPQNVTGTVRPLFVFVGALATDPPVDPAWITHATPLLLVHRDDPGTPYWEEDRVWLRRSDR